MVMLDFMFSETFSSFILVRKEVVEFLKNQHEKIFAILWQSLPDCEWNIRVKLPKYYDAS